MLKWCVIGAGGIADRRAIPAILKEKSSTLVAIMERVPTLARELGEKYGVPYFTSVEDMLSSVDADAVYIGTPTAKHGDDLRAAIRHGVHAFVEKPLCVEPEEAESLLSEFRSAGLQLTVGYMMKYHNLHLKAKELIRDGRVGSVTLANARFSCWYPAPEGAWRQYEALSGGGALMDLGVHCIELLEYLLGDEITEVKAMIANRAFPYEVEDTGVIIYRTKGGTHGTIEASFAVPDAASESQVEIFGTGGYIKALGTMSQEESGRLLHLYAPQGEYNPEQGAVSSEPVEYYAEGEDIYLRQIRDFVNTVLGNSLEYTYAAAAVRVQKIMALAYADAKK